MIEFIQDYQTKAVPPETFADGQQVERSEASERYFVGLGVAGYLVDGQLVDQDHQPIVRVATAPVVSTDRRFTDTGRGGETLGLNAPARATSGPGNVVLTVKADVAADDLDKLKASFEEKMRLAVVQNDEREADAVQLHAALATVEKERDAARAVADAAAKRIGEVEASLSEANGRADAAAADLAAANARIAELEAAASPPADDASASPPTDATATGTTTSQRKARG